MTEPAKTKEYVGDGVYIDTDYDGGIVLTTENGVSTTNTIYLDYEVVISVLRYLRKYHVIDLQLRAL